MDNKTARKLTKAINRLAEAIESQNTKAPAPAMPDQVIPMTPRPLRPRPVGPGTNPYDQIIPMTPGPLYPWPFVPGVQPDQVIPMTIPMMPRWIWREPTWAPPGHIAHPIIITCESTSDRLTAEELDQQMSQTWVELELHTMPAED